MRLHDLHDLEVKCRRKELKFSHFDGNAGTFHSFSAIISLNRQKLLSITQKLLSILTYSQGRLKLIAWQIS